MRPRTLAAHLTTFGFHKLIQIAGALSFAFLIPRLLGPERFGQLSFVYSLGLIVQMAGDLGGLDIMGRFGPGWSTAGERGRQQTVWLVWQLFVLRLILGLLLTVGLALLLPRFVFWISPWQAALLGLVVALRLLSWTAYHLAFALNQTGRWLFELSWRQILLTPLLWGLAPLGLDGILLALLATEFLFLLPGLYWTRPYLRPRPFSWPRLKPFLQFGLRFFLANVFIIWLYQSGPVLLEFLTHDTVAVGHLGLALNVFMLFTVVYTQALASFVPTLSLLRGRDRAERLAAWLDGLTRYSALTMALCFIGVAFLAQPITPLVFGRGYTPAAGLMLTLSLALLLQPPVWIGRYAATALGHSRALVAGAMAGASTMILLVTPLILRLHSIGATWALVVGLAAFAGVLGRLARDWLPLPWRRLGQIYAPLVLMLPLFYAEQALLPRVLLLLAFACVYLLLMRRLGIISLSELRQALAGALDRGA
ncbi:MAG: hypothetical protein D6775_17010 [Caldilineae bacterium]|nr:MAG: hypothetical protein D6775_17010 [Caldilineae bacterium]